MTLLELSRWDRMTIAEKERFARGLDLPSGFRFSSLARQAAGTLEREVAIFEHAGSRFVLVPGGEVELGHDPNAGISLSPSQLADWNETQEEYGVTLDDFIAKCFVPKHTAILQALLVEEESGLLGYTPIESAYGGATGNTLTFSSDGITRTTEQGAVYRIEWRTQQQAIDHAGKAGFTLPTSDQWEHCCRAGGQTLFWWGDDFPAVGYSVDDLPFDKHRGRNAFGLAIAQDPYHWEVCAERGVLRGGDGGSAICGGAGFVAGWLPLASAYLDPSASNWDDQPIPDTRIRRVLVLS